MDKFDFDTAFIKVLMEDNETLPLRCLKAFLEWRDGQDAETTEEQWKAYLNRFEEEYKNFRPTFEVIQGGKATSEVTSTQQENENGHERNP